MDSELTRRVTLYWMLAISVVVVVLVLMQFMNQEGIWMMQMTDEKRWWTTHITRKLNVIQIALAALVLLVLMGLAFLYERRVRYSEHTFFLLVSMLQVSTMEAQQFAATVPQSFWAPVVMAMAFTTLRWSAVVLAVQLVMVLAFWGLSGAFAQLVPMVFFCLVFSGLATGRYLRDQEILAAKRDATPAAPREDEDGLPSPKRSAPSNAASKDGAKPGGTSYSNSTPEGRAFLEQLNRRLADGKD